MTYLIRCISNLGIFLSRLLSIVNLHVMCVIILKIMIILFLLNFHRILLLKEFSKNFLSVLTVPLYVLIFLFEIIYLIFFRYFLFSLSLMLLLDNVFIFISILNYLTPNIKIANLSIMGHQFVGINLFGTDLIVFLFYPAYEESF